MKKTFPLLLVTFSLILIPILAVLGKVEIDAFSKKEIFFNTNSKTVNDPELTGPDRICNVFGTVLVDYFGGGNPSTDVYSWTITDPSNQILFDGKGGAGFQTISYTFSIIGSHQVKLIVTRGGIEIGNFTKEVEVIQGPEILLKEDYTLCESQEIELIALSTSSADFSKYEFEWRDETNTVIGTENILKTSQTGTYSVTFFFLNALAEKACETTLTTNVVLSAEYSISSNANFLCPDGSITFSSVPEANGEWILQKNGDPVLTPIGVGKTKTITSGIINSGPGDYTIIFKVPNPNNPACIQSSSSTFTVNIQPEVEFFSAIEASGCFESDGALELTALTPIDLIGINGTSVTYGPFASGDLITIPGLKSGAYTLFYQLGNCSNTLGSVVPLVDPPAELEFEITDIQSEICTETGKENGSFLVNLINGPVPDGSYRVVNQKGSQILNEKLGMDSQFQISIPGGTYFFEIFDKDSCNLPKREEFEVPGLTQVAFSVPGNLSVCQSFDLVPQTSQNLEFTLSQPDGSIENRLAGEAFTLTQPGEYSLVGKLPGQNLICPLLRKITVDLVDPVEYEPVLIDQDCFGNLTYEANIFGRDPASVRFRWFDENNQLVGTGQFLNPISFGIYKLDVQPSSSSACPIPPKEFEIKKPILSVEVTLESTKLCEFGPRAILSLTSTFPEEITDIEWRRYDDLGTIDNLPQFKDQTEIIVDEAGTYESSVFSRIPSINKDCELGRQVLRVDLIPDKVPFAVPDSLSICDPYTLIPTASSPLEFELIFPDGKVEIKDWNEAFILDQEGEYIILGYDPDIQGPLCPDQKTIKVTINPPVQFNPHLVEISCEGEYQFQALVENYPLNEVDFFWKDSNENLVGSQSTFFTTIYGSYTLEVQPKGSIPCQISPIIFEAPEPVLSVVATLIAEPLCPDQTSAALAVEADLTEVSKIEWWFTSIDNERVPLISETDKIEILAISEGTYEVILRNQFGCQLGRDQVLILRSQDTVRPEVEDSYQVCPRYEIGPVIDPGNFASYEWYFEESLVATSPTYKPLQVGNYRLLVFSTEGCAYETSFVTEEECELRVAFPDAIQPGNPDKPFLIYTNYLIDELEIWIFNKWGQMIFHCRQTELISEESTCGWDGYFDGEKIPPGSYAYRMTYRNYEKNIVKEQLGSIFVID